METREIKLTYKVYETNEQLTEAERTLMNMAHEACNKSYAPYSQFYVGAAARLSNGKIVSGGNQENAAYPMCLCAERVVLAAIAAEYPNEQVEAMAIAVHNPRLLIQQPGTPCGACRQVISEQEDRQQSPIRLLLQGETGPIFDFSSGKQLLPLAFSGDIL